jgi:hypothetical protein
MSLDVYLDLPGTTAPDSASRPRIFVREEGQTREISRAAWDEKNPDREPVTADVGRPFERVYEANVTHNLNRMAEQAGVYYACWRPEEIGVTRAAQLIPMLRQGLENLLINPGHFRSFSPPNGWGTYEGFVDFLKGYLTACETWPEAQVSVSR